MVAVFALPGNEALAIDLANLTGSQRGELEVRRFPDEESYVRVLTDVAGQDIFLVCSLSSPDSKFLPLVFAARTIRELGAASVGLIAPYLPYLRQDKAFHPGEALSSKIFADLLSREFDSLITVDPHLHRYSSLDELYAIPAHIVRSAALIGRWAKVNVPSALIVGPDRESAQWVAEIAAIADVPWTVFRKDRRGDRDVQLAAPPLAAWRNRTPVLVDDIISSGATMIEGAELILACGLKTPYCVAVHALFDAATGAKIDGIARQLLTTDTILNEFSHFQMGPLIAEQIEGGISELK